MAQNSGIPTAALATGRTVQSKLLSVGSPASALFWNAEHVWQTFWRSLWSSGSSRFVLVLWGGVLDNSQAYALAMLLELYSFHHSLHFFLCSLCCGQTVSTFKLPSLLRDLNPYPCSAWCKRCLCYAAILWLCQASTVPALPAFENR